MESLEQSDELPDWAATEHWYPLYLRYHAELERSRIEDRKNFLATLQVEKDESELTKFMRMIHGAHGMTTLKDEVEADIF